MSEWISVKDKLPDDNTRVLCYEKYESIGMAYVGYESYYYRKGIGFVHLHDDDDPYGCITHWMPLPEPPKE